MKVINMFINQRGGSIKAFAKVKTKEGFVIDGFRVCEGSKGLFIGWPTKEVMKDGQKEYYPVVTTDEEPENNPFRQEVNENILTRYMEEMGSRGVSVSVNKGKSGSWASKGKQQVSGQRYTNGPTSNEVPDDQAVIVVDDDDWA
jgi:DNA-binding cell septation regulator SpoVG